MQAEQLEFAFEETRLFSVKATATHLGISRRTLERLYSRGDFPFPMKIGRKSLFTSDDIKVFVAKLKDRRTRTHNLSKEASQ
jgi:excisionase family DNA binding protein